MDIQKPDSRPKAGMSQKVSAGLSYITAAGVKRASLKSRGALFGSGSARSCHPHCSGVTFVVLIPDKEKSRHV